MKHLEYVLLDVNLTLFDEGGAAPAPAPGGEGATEGATGGESGSGDADLNTNDKAVKVIYGKQDIDNGIEEPPKGDDPEPEPGPEDQIDPAKRESQFEELIKGDYKELFDKRVQNIINQRFKETKQLEETVNKVNPVLDLLKEKYGVDNEDALLEQLENEAYEELAFKEDMSPEQYKRMKQLERENQELKFKTNTEESQKQVQERVDGWYKEADQLKGTKDNPGPYPDFDLKAASQNNEFLNLLKAGVNVKAAYEAAFFDQILNQKMSAATKQAESNVVENIRSKKQRIQENGTKANPGVIVKSSTKDLSARDRAEIARRAAMGESIKF